MKKLDIEQFKAMQIPHMGNIVSYNSRELKIQKLAEKINEIVDFVESIREED